MLFGRYINNEQTLHGARKQAEAKSKAQVGTAQGAAQKTALKQQADLPVPLDSKTTPPNQPWQTAGCGATTPKFPPVTLQGKHA